jgi:Mn-dependent DtxR family transcriptional regulator
MTNMQRLVEQLEHCTSEEFYETIDNIINGCGYCCQKPPCAIYDKNCKDQFVLWGAQQADEQ